MPWQQAHGKPSSGRYHNRQRAAKIKRLDCIHRTPGARKPASASPTAIIAGGPYARAYAKLKTIAFERVSKTKFSCPDCEQNAWEKPDAQLICGNCYEDGQVVDMLAEPAH